MSRALAGRFTAWARSRGQAFGLVASAAAFVAFAKPAPEEPSLPALERLVGSAAGVEVIDGALAWEPGGGALDELFFGRPLLFLGAQSGGRRDLYRAFVRLTPHGAPLAVRRIRDLTNTPDADETGLVVRGDRAAFATLSAGRVVAVTTLEGLGGRPAPTRPRGFFARLAARVRQGSFTPLARTDFVLLAPSDRVVFSLVDERLELDLGAQGGARAIDFVRRRFDGPGKPPLEPLARGLVPASALLATVDAAREAFGSGVVGLAGRALAGVAAFRRRLPLVGAGMARAEAPRSLRGPMNPPPAMGGAAAEGLFTRRVVLPEPVARGSRLVLVTIDMRALELGVVAGASLPRATASVPGDGRLPRDPALLSRVVACFNGGDEEPASRVGAMARSRLLAPPVASLPSVSLTLGHEVLFGTWPFGAAVPPNLVGFEQRTRALVGDRAGSGAPKAGDESRRRRSALCALGGGHLAYAYAEGMTRAGLEQSLERSGCVYALPLAADPERLGFALAHVPSPGAGRFELADPAMDFDADATLAGLTRGFFYLSWRKLSPELPASVSFHPDAGKQPPPTWSPAIFTGTLAMGKLVVTLVSLERGHLDYRLRAGPRELGARGEPWAGALDDAAVARALAAIELGHATAANRFGLVLGASVPLPVRSEYATLVVGEEVPPRILLPGESVTLAHGEQAVQLPLLADDHDITVRARARGGFRPRAALGIAEGGRVVVAIASHDSSDPLAVALRAAGCRRVVELDRGSHHPAFIHRAGTDTPPRTDYESTTLWALARPTLPAVVVAP